MLLHILCADGARTRALGQLYASGIREIVADSTPQLKLKPGGEFVDSYEGLIATKPLKLRNGIELRPDYITPFFDTAPVFPLAKLPASGRKWMHRHLSGLPTDLVNLIQEFLPPLTRIFTRAHIFDYKLQRKPPRLLMPFENIPYPQPLDTSELVMLQPNKNGDFQVLTNYTNRNRKRFWVRRNQLEAMTKNFSLAFISNGLTLLKCDLVWLLVNSVPHLPWIQLPFYATNTMFIPQCIQTDNWKEPLSIFCDQGTPSRGYLDQVTLMLELLKQSPPIVYPATTTDRVPGGVWYCIQVIVCVEGIPLKQSKCFRSPLRNIRVHSSETIFLEYDAEVLATVAPVLYNYPVTSNYWTYYFPFSEPPKFEMPAFLQSNFCSGFNEARIPEAKIHVTWNKSVIEETFPNCAVSCHIYIHSSNELIERDGLVGVRWSN